MTYDMATYAVAARGATAAQKAGIMLSGTILLEILYLAYTMYVQCQEDRSPEAIRTQFAQNYDGTEYRRGFHRRCRSRMRQAVTAKGVHLTPEEIDTLTVISLDQVRTESDDHVLVTACHALTKDMSQ